MRRVQLRRDDRGSAVEAAILAPALILLVGLGIAFGRVQIAQGSIEDAASASARQASLARDPYAAQAIAEQTAADTLAAQGLECLSLVVNVDTSAMTAPVGQLASVSTSITCEADMSGIAIPGLPGSVTLQADWVSAIDRYRQRP